MAGVGSVSPVPAGGVAGPAPRSSSSRMRSTRVPRSAVSFLAQVQLGDPPQPQHAEAGPHERHRPAQRAERILPLVWLADERDPNGGVAEVACDVHPGDGHEADARVVDVAADDAR